LKKAWSCPEAFKEKAAKKKYKEIWDSRTDWVTDYIANDAYVHNKEIGDYVQSIVNQLVSANRSLLPNSPLVMLDRDASVNAYAVGGNFLAVNLGLIAWCKTREELAFTLAHELSHNILKHWETSTYETAKWLSSDEYKQSLNSVLDSKYDRLTRLEKVMENAVMVFLQDRIIFQDRVNLDDSLKTHPDCPVRYEKTKQWATANPTFTPVPRNIHEIATRMLIWNMYTSTSLTSCLYRILLIKDEGNTDPWYDFMVSNIITGLLFADHKLSRFYAIALDPEDSDSHRKQAAKIPEKYEKHI
jgi:hypothetical protein